MIYGDSEEWDEVYGDFQRMSDDDLITVCDGCFRACCWQGIFMCDKSLKAGTVQKTRKELRTLRLEDPSYFKTDKELGWE